MTDTGYEANFWNITVPLKSVKLGVPVVYVKKHSSGPRIGQRCEVEPCDFGHIVGFGVRTVKRSDHAFLCKEVLAARVQFSQMEPEVILFENLELL